MSLNLIIISLFCCPCNFDAKSFDNSINFTLNKQYTIPSCMFVIPSLFVASRMDEPFINCIPKRETLAKFSFSNNFSTRSLGNCMFCAIVLERQLGLLSTIGEELKNLVNFNDRDGDINDVEVLIIASGPLREESSIILVYLVFKDIEDNKNLNIMSTSILPVNTESLRDRAKLAQLNKKPLAIFESIAQDSIDRENLSRS